MDMTRMNSLLCPETHDSVCILCSRPHWQVGGCIPWNFEPPKEQDSFPSLEAITMELLQKLARFKVLCRPERSSDQPFEHIFASASIGLGRCEQPDSFGGCRVLIAELLLLVLPVADSILMHPH